MPAATRTGLAADLRFWLTREYFIFAVCQMPSAPRTGLKADLRFWHTREFFIYLQKKTLRGGHPATDALPDITRI